MEYRTPIFDSIDDVSLFFWSSKIINMYKIQKGQYFSKVMKGILENIGEVRRENNNTSNS